MSRSILEPGALRRALSIRDLTDPSAGPHAMQLVLGDLVSALTNTWGCEMRLHRASPLVSVEDNYDRLHYPAGGAARDARYTRYASERTLLRTQTSAMIPPLLREIGAAASPPADLLLVCPGLVYRRDTLDRLHTGEPHQVDLWRIRAGARLDVESLRAMIARVIAAALPGWEWRAVTASHPYTTDGLQIDVRDRSADRWVEIGECGLALPALLAESGLDPARVSGLAMGLGLDRLVMLRKGLDDIRLLRAEDPRIAAQMLDLSPYRAVSQMPPVRRDLSIAVDADDTAEELGDRVRTALGPRAPSVEAVEVVGETPAAALPAVAGARLGIAPAQKNVLLRVVLRDLDRTLTHEEANDLRDAIYAALLRGTVWHWASGHPPRGS